MKNIVTAQQIPARLSNHPSLGVIRVQSLVLVILGSGAGSAFSQEASADISGAPAEVVVTGTRVIRDGYQAPTPTTVVGMDQLQTVAASNVADALNELPQYVGSSTPLSSAGGINNHQGGINGIGLRGLGINRTLVLLDGQRIVGDIDTGVVDVNQLPQQLIKRVDTVFGGASAEYGSDALTGVVNFVLDDKFTGVKGEVSGGITDYGDDSDWKTSVAAGTTFADGRGHIVVSGEAAANAGIITTANNRSWNTQGFMMMHNPAFGTGAGQSTSVPAYIAMSAVGMSNAAPGGLITSGPLKGTLFGQGGAVSMINYGPVIADPLMSGGDWRETNEVSVFGIALDPKQRRQNAFARVTYDLSDDVAVYGQFQFAHATEVSTSVANYFTGDLTVFANNPFIPSLVAQSLAAHGVTSFQMGSMNEDLIGTTPTYDRTVDRFLTGAQGKLDVFGSPWKWDAHVSYGRHEGTSSATNTITPTNYMLAIDAVRSPNTGAIVCRSTLTNPNNGCVPYNLFGIGVNSAAAIDYVEGGKPFYNEEYSQSVEGFNISGEPFSIWAGPLSIAFGVEHRQEATFATADPGEAAGQWFITSGTPFSGGFSVTEGYVETVIPLATNTLLAKKLELIAAARPTDYSTFGIKETWKLGLNYSPVEEIRFRGTFSHDLREPTLVDLYSAPVSSTFQIADPFLNNKNVNYTGYSVGNPALQPESARSFGLGAVYQPSWLQGFSLSFDYYYIDISDAITTFSATQLINLCYEGSTTACSGISQIGTDANGLPILKIVSGPENFASEKARGFDIEGSYALPVDKLFGSWKGLLNFHMLATHAISDVQTSGAPGTIPVQLAGQNIAGGVPHWKFLTDVDYHLDPVTVGVTVRGVSAGVYSNNWITCTTSCPVSTANNITTDWNYMASAVYLDLNFRFDIRQGIELFVNVKNVLNSSPAVYYPGPDNNSWQKYAADPTDYDILGRIYRAGVRFQL